MSSFSSRMPKQKDIVFAAAIFIFAEFERLKKIESSPNRLHDSERCFYDWTLSFSLSNPILGDQKKSPCFQFTLELIMQQQKQQSLDKDD